MSSQRIYALLGLLVFLIVANTIYYYIMEWGLITVKVQASPLRLVIRSIERQGWVQIVTNLDPETPVSMYVDHVPLKEAMETLSANVEANWKLGYFTGPSSGEVNREIVDFSNSGGAEVGPDWKIFSYGTPLRQLGNPDDDTSPVPDPYLETWNGVLPPPPAPVPPAQAPDGTFSAAPAAPIPRDQGTILSYLRETARASSIWIMAPADWVIPVAAAPAAPSSIRTAVRRLVRSAHGYEKEVLVVEGRHRGRGERGGFGNDLEASYARLDNEISTLPVDEQEGLRQQAIQEKSFWTGVLALPPEQRMPLIQQHLIQNGSADRRANANRRLSPEKRAARYRAMVQVKMAAMGKTPGGGGAPAAK